MPPHHAFATRRSVSLADAASEPFIGLAREEYPDYHSFLTVIFGPVKIKPHLVEEHDSISGVLSSVEAGFLAAQHYDVPCVRLPLKKGACTSSTPPTLTVNPGKPSYLQFFPSQRAQMETMSPF